MREYFVMLNGRRVGPYSHAEIAQAVRSGRTDAEAAVIDLTSGEVSRAGELARKPAVEDKPSVHIPTSGGTREPRARRKDEEYVRQARDSLRRAREREEQSGGSQADAPQDTPEPGLHDQEQQDAGHSPGAAPSDSLASREELARSILRAVRAKGFRPPPGQKSVLEWYLEIHEKEGSQINLIPADPTELALLAVKCIRYEDLAQIERLQAASTRDTRAEMAKVQVPDSTASQPQPSVNNQPSAKKIEALQKWAVGLGVASVFLYWIGIVPIVGCLVSLVSLVHSKNQRQTNWSVGGGALSGLFFFVYLAHYGHI